MRLRFVLFIAVLFLVYTHGADQSFRNMSEKELLITLEYADCAPLMLRLANGETIHIPTSCTLTKIKASKAQGGAINEFEDYESGNASYYFLIEIDFPSLVKIKKETT